MSDDDTGTVSDGGSGTAGDADLLTVAAAVVALDALVVLPVLRDTPLRPLLSVPVLLVGPGYALVAALYPDDPPVVGLDTTDGPDDPRLSRLGRLALSLAGSVAVVAGVGLVAAVYARFAAVTVVPGVSAATLALLALARIRRRRAHPGVRDGVDVAALRDRARVWIARDRFDVILSVVVLLAVVGAATGVYVHAAGANVDPGTAALLAPAGDGSGTTASGSSGAIGYVAAGYPRDLTVGHAARYAVAVSNPGQSAAPVTVVAVLERYPAGARGDATLPSPTASTVLARASATADAGGTATLPVSVTPTDPGSDDRLAFLVYRGAVPSSPTPANADDELHLWVRVASAGASPTKASTTATTAAAAVATPTPVASGPFVHRSGVVGA